MATNWWHLSTRSYPATQRAKWTDMGSVLITTWLGVSSSILLWYRELRSCSVPTDLLSVRCRKRCLLTALPQTSARQSTFSPWLDSLFQTTTTKKKQRCNFVLERRLNAKSRDPNLAIQMEWARLFSLNNKHLREDMKAITEETVVEKTETICA